MEHGGTWSQGDGESGRNGDKGIAISLKENMGLGHSQLSILN